MGAGTAGPGEVATMSGDRLPIRAGWPLIRAAAVLALLTAAGLLVAAPASAEPDLSVTQALAAKDGRSASVIGYVVGQPVATNTVLRSGFTGDTAVAVADSAAETDLARTLY